MRWRTGSVNNLFNVWLMLGCALVGYFFLRVGRRAGATLLGIVAILFLLMVFPAIRRSREQALAE